MSSSFSCSLFFLLCEEVKFVSVFLNGFVRPILALILLIMLFFFIFHMPNGCCEMQYVSITMFLQYNYT